MKVAVLMGVLISAPYIIYQLFRFISPALYQDEKNIQEGYIVFPYIVFRGSIT